MLGKIFLLSEVRTWHIEQVWREEYSFSERKIVHKARLADCHGRGNFAEKEAQSPRQLNGKKKGTHFQSECLYNI